MSLRLLKGPFTVDDYHRLADVGILGEDDRWPGPPRSCGCRTPWSWANAGSSSPTSLCCDPEPTATARHTAGPRTFCWRSRSPTLPCGGTVA